MGTTFKDGEQEAVWEVMQAINRAWVHGRPDEMEPHLHPDMVIVTSDVEYRADGRDACIDTYKDFCKRATIQDYKEDQPNVDIFDEQAVVIYQFDSSISATSWKAKSTGTGDPTSSCSSGSRISGWLSGARW
jgi:hypothetical protein